MRRQLTILGAIALAACSAQTQAEPQAETQAQNQAQPQTESQIIEVAQKTETQAASDLSLRRTDPKTATAQDIETPPTKPVQKPVQKIGHASDQLRCHGIAKQGGLVVCQTTPNARVEVGRGENDTYTQTAGPDGRLIVGFDRDEPNAFIRVGDQRVDFKIEKRSYDISRIDGLPKRFVSEYTEEQLKQIRSASARKKIGFASKVKEIGFRNGFISPVSDYTKTTNFGAQRVLNGDPKRPHFGVDMAAPTGTPIVAPADGIVSLADEDMYFEGSLIMIDHGQGLISYYLHNESVLVEAGQKVTQGQQIGTIGSRGRSTGPHLCWRLKWRGRNLDPELLLDWPQDGPEDAH